ncbi:MAG: FkbM family methyltransferase [Chloroflexi bacterium]|nr:MAG: FkbM family methyltransferase [Chloroflexota bacterium]
MSRSLASVLRAVAKSDSPAAQVARRLATPVFQRMDLVVPARLAGGGVLYVELANEVGRTIWLRGEYRSEKPIKDLIVSILRPGDVFFDVGANVGFFSLVGAQAVGEKGAVHAFEPLPHLAALIRRTVARNKLANVRVLEMAVSASTRAVQMAAMKDSAYSHILEGASKVDAGRGGWREMSVQTTSLDEYLAGQRSKAPRLIKMDIEGAEMAALAGARDLLSNPAGPDVICEVGQAQLSRYGHSPQDVFDRFQAFGYAALDPETLKPMSVADLSEVRYNVFFKKLNR